MKKLKEIKEHVLKIRESAGDLNEVDYHTHAILNILDSFTVDEWCFTEEDIQLQPEVIETGTSNCCDAKVVNGDICSECLEHCEVVK